MKKKIVISALIVAVFLAGCIQQPEEVIKIGVVDALTGSAADYGLPVLHGALIAKDEINAEGGINGKPIEFIIEDGKCSPKEAATAAQKLINIDRVDVLLTGCSSETLAVAPIATDSKIIVIAMVSTSPAVSEAGDYVFRTSPSDLLGLKKFAEATFSKLDYKKVAVFSELRDYPQGLREGFVDEFKKLGGTITASETFTEETIDLRTNLFKLAESEPDALVFFVQTTGAAALLLKQVKELDIKLPILGNEVFGGDVVLNVAGDAAEGVVFVTPKLDVTREKTKALLQKYYDAYPTENPPNILYVATAYDAVYLLKESIEKCGTNTACIKSYLYSLKDWEGATGVISFDENGDPIYAYVIKTVKNGEFVLYEGD